MPDHDQYRTAQAGFEEDRGPRGELTQVPDVVGVGAVAAQTLLVGIGFGVGFETIPSSDEGALVVLEQDPSADTVVTLPAFVLLRIGSGVPQPPDPPVDPPAQVVSPFDS